jgi:hypothetical protein
MSRGPGEKPAFTIQALSPVAGSLNKKVNSIHRRLVVGYTGLRFSDGAWKLMLAGSSSAGGFER